MDYILVLFISYLAKIIRFLSKLLKKGSGTSLPGLIIEKKFPFLTRYWNGKYKKVVFISGTNGKTTVRSILNKIYSESGYKTVTNIGGANIMRGIASTLLFDLDLFGRTKSDLLILEVEEATLPKITKFLEPDQLILTNIFRDQLDAYGEIDQTLDYFVQAIKNCSPQVIINGDDNKLLSILKPEFKNVIQFKVDSQHNPNYEKSEITNRVDDFFVVKNLNFENFKTGFEVFKSSKKIINIKDFNLSGVFNVYNLLAVISSLPQDLDLKSIDNLIKDFNPVFGRGEQISLQNDHRIFLVKNPAGFDQVLDLINLNCNKKPVNLIIAINDKIADGRDVSWLWDINLEGFLAKQKISNIYTGGGRGLDMLLRLKYAGVGVDIKNNFETINQMVEFLNNEKEEYIILATYTAMRQIRGEISKYAEISDIADEGN